MKKLVLALFVIAGCSSPTRTITGQLDTTQMSLAGAKVVARSSAGRVFTAPIAANGSFSIALPTRATYTMRFANSTSTPRFYDVFATLAARRPSRTTHWFTLTPGATVALGRVARAGVVAATHSGLTALSDGSGDDSGKADDKGEHEDDGAEACDVDQGKDDADVESDHDVNDDVSSNKDGVADSKEDDHSRATCASATSGDDKCELDDREEKELDDDADKPCSGGGGADGGSIPAPVRGLI